MNKFILGLLLIPVLLVGICAVSASLDDGGAEISIADDGVDIAGISIAGDGVDSPSDFKYTGEKKIRALTLKDLEEFAKGMKNPIDPQPAPPEYLKSLKEPMYQQLWIVGLC